MRRVVSAIFLFLGGWLLTAEPILAFMDFGPGMGGAMPAVLAFVLLLAAVPLGIGVALSPGSRWRSPASASRRCSSTPASSNSCRQCLRCPTSRLCSGR